MLSTTYNYVYLAHCIVYRYILKIRFYLIFFILSEQMVDFTLSIIDGERGEEGLNSLSVHASDGQIGLVT